MDKATAISDAKRLLGTSADLLTETDWGASADRAMTAPDAYDPWLLAAEAADLLGIRAQGEGMLTEVSSEGTTMKRTPADYFSMAALLRGKSANAKSSSIGVVSVGVDATDGVHGIAVGGYGPGYWTWDGDVPVWYPYRSPELP